MEYEAKLLGAREALSRCYRNFMAAADSLRDRHYSFNTYYLDNPRGAFYDAGFSLRHRAPELDMAPNTEIKALKGEHKGISARIEEGVEGIDPLKNYFALMASEQYPKTAPKIPPQSLEIIFATAVRRNERCALVELCGRPWIVEAALDDIAYLRNEGKTGSGLFDAVLYPSGAEHELELELKPVSENQKVTDQVLGQFMAWVAGNVVKEQAGAVAPTTVSKALRAREFTFEAKI